MNFLEEKPIRCYHRVLKTLFEVVAIDWLERKVKVVKSINIDQPENVDQIIEVFDFNEVKIIRYAENVDDTNRPIYEDDIVYYGDNLRYQGIVGYSNIFKQWVIEPISEDDNQKHRLADISPQYLHIIENNGRSME